MFIRGSSFCFSKHEIAALLAYASDDETRPHIYGVGVFPSVGHVACTNGKHLAVLASHDGDTADVDEVSGNACANYIIPRPVLAMATKACPQKGILSIVNGQIDLYEDETVLPAEGLELGTFSFAGSTDPFPPYENVIPRMHTSSPTAALAVNPLDLALLATVAKACDKPGAVLYVPESQADPILVVMGEWRIVTMPMETEEARARAKETASKGARAAVDEIAKAVGEGNSVTFSVPGEKPVTLKGKGAKKN